MLAADAVIGDGASPDLGRAALIIAHPGHELRLHHWIERVRPLVFVLTHGDGHGRASRLASTTRVLERAGAELGSVYGRWRDRELYQALLDGHHASVVDAVEEITAALASRSVEYVVADAEERYNPSHDVCRYVATTVTACLAARGVSTGDFEFPLVAAPDALLGGSRADEDALVWRLDDAALARKLDAARQYPEMADEVARALEAFGEAAFRIECVTRVRPSPLDATTRPFYEAHGEAQVAAGRYPSVLRYDMHARPLRERLLALVPGAHTAGSDASSPGTRRS